MSKKTLLLLVLVLCLLAVFVGCEEEEPQEDSTKLLTPVLTLQGDIVSWDAIENADYYDIYVNGEKIYASPETSYQLTYRVNGTYKVQIMARCIIGELDDSDLSQSVDYLVNRKELSEPIIQLADSTVMWQSVDGATQYEVFVNGVQEDNPAIKASSTGYSWTINRILGGEYIITVKAISTSMRYEYESSHSNEVCYKLSTDKKWSSEQISSDWELHGNGIVHYGGFCLECIGGVSSRISNRVFIDDVRTQLRIGLKKKLVSGDSQINPQLRVYVDGQSVRGVDQERDTISTDSTEFVFFTFDLSAFANKVVDIEISSVGAEHAIIGKIQLTTVGNISTFTKWYTNDIDFDWETSGTVVLHEEGVCLESQGGALASISNNVKITDDYPWLNLAFRKFVREGEQDTNPQIRLYVNDVLIKAIDNEQDFVTALDDNYTQHSYDLSAYVGQTVTVKIESSAGEHACFNKIFFSTVGNNSIYSSWDIEYMQADWSFEGQIEVHTEGVCLEYSDDTPAAMTVNVIVDRAQSDFNIYFRKFVRATTQDADPQIKVYVDGILIRAIGSDQDYVTATDNKYQRFTYDLYDFEGESVTIRIESVAGEHACFNLVCFTAHEE